MSNAINREKEYLQNFKTMLRDMLYLLRTSLKAETVSMHWVNDTRDLLVLENYTTKQKNVVFKDRVEKQSSFLGKYANIKSVTRLEIGNQIPVEYLEHYTSEPPVRYIYLVPFKYGSETVAVTSVETSEKSQLTETDETLLTAYEDIQYRLLQTYLELSDLSEKQIEWTEYDEIAQNLTKKTGIVELAGSLLEEIQLFAGKKGGTLLLARGMDDWHSVLHSKQASYPPPVGLTVQSGSISEQALTSGEPFFSPHFNANPKRISVQEPLCKGASLAVPVMHQQRRQMLVLVYNENPLVFTEAAKHKVNNLCRIAGLKIEAMLPGLDVDEDIFATSLGVYKQELFNLCLSSILDNISGNNGVLRTWGGMISIGNIADLRTKYRLEDLTGLQQEVLRLLCPPKYGITGILGEYSDYIYTFLLQSPDETAFDHWCKGVMETFKSPVSFSGGKMEQVEINMGYAMPDGVRDSGQIMQVAKQAMNSAVKNKEFKVEAS